MRTRCKAEMKFIDVTALQDATVTTSDNQSYGNTSLFLNNTEQKDYGTFEKNQFVLDGSKEILPDNPVDVAFWSNNKSGSDCTFSKPPAIDIIFSTIHSSSGITLYFANEYPKAVRLTWYTMSGTRLEDKTFYPNSLIYVCENQVANYGKLRIEILSTQFPDRYARLQYLLYGIVIRWDEDVIQTASVTEEIDVTSATLSINTAEVSIVDVANDFDIGNEDGAWKSVQKNQEIVLTELVDGEVIPCGTFFMDDFSFEGNVASFKLIDLIGLTDKYTYELGGVYNGVKAGVLLESVFATCGITKYTIDKEVYDTLLSGYLGIQKCRAAIQMIVFACGAVADDSRSDTIRIYKPDRYVSHTIGIDRKFYGETRASQEEYVSGVNIACNKYALSSDVTEIYNGTLPKGVSKITFTEPYLASSITVSAGSIVEVKTNYILVKMNAAGACTISGKKYESSEFSYQKNVDFIASGEVENIKDFGTCTLYNTNGMEDLTESLLKYYGLRKNIEMHYILEDEQVGNWCNIRDVNQRVSTTLIESQTIDLTGGFLANAKCRGYSIVVTENYYTGTELYSGGDVLL